MQRLVPFTTKHLSTATCGLAAGYIAQQQLLTSKNTFGFVAHAAESNDLAKKSPFNSQQESIAREMMQDRMRNDQQHNALDEYQQGMAKQRGRLPGPPSAQGDAPFNPDALTGTQDTTFGHRRPGSRQTLGDVIENNPQSVKQALSDEEFEKLNQMALDQQKKALKEAKERMETEYIVNTLARRDGLAAGSQTVQLTKKDIDRMQRYQSPLVTTNKQVHAYESSFISPVPHMIYEPAPAGEFFIWPKEIETLALYLVNDAGYELLRKPWHPNRFISGRNHLLGREEFELYGRTCPSHPTRPKAVPVLPFIDDRLKYHPAIPQDKHAATLFGIAHCGPFTEALVQDYVDEGMMMGLLNRVAHSTLLLNNVTGRPESSAFHFKRMPNPGEPMFISATLEYSANKDKALICAAVFDADLDASYLDAKAVFKIMKSTDFDQHELDFIDKQTLPSLQQVKYELKTEQEQKPAQSFLGGLISGITGGDEKK